MNTTSSTTVGGVAVGDTVVVTYCYTDSSYFTPLLFDDYSLVEATYGQALITTLPTLPTDPQIVSPLSLAAWIAMSNGANVVLCLATDPTDGDLRAQLVAAYEKLRGDYRIGTLVPVLADDDVDGSQALFQNYGSDLKVHVEQSLAALLSLFRFLDAHQGAFTFCFLRTLGRALEILGKTISGVFFEAATAVPPTLGAADR